MIMNYEILPGPSLAELARTALARAAAATVSEAGPANARQDVAGRVPVRTRPDGSPLLLAATGSMLEQRLTTCPDALRSVEFGGAVAAEVPVEAFQAAAPDPLWRVAPGILEHLENGHMAELAGCVRAHGLGEADWVIPRGLDRHGLELLVLTPDGTVAVRLSFPDGPVSS